MWPWRDWVIHAYNSNIPYDEFITWQLAGDLIPNATKEQIIATGFNRNHKITQEGGVIPEEYRVEYVADRAITTSKLMMGLTMECARCHSHKYDNITHDEFYGFYSFFNNIDEEGLIQYGDYAPKPRLTISKSEVNDNLDFIKLPDSLDKVTFMVMKESENLRKRTIKEIADAKKYSHIYFIRDLVSSVDNLQRALEAVPNDKSQLSEQIKNLVIGLEIVEKEILNTFEKHSLKQINPLGEKFDYNLHQAMFEVPTNEKEPGYVVEVSQKGYLLHDRLVRPAMVGI